MNDNLVVKVCTSPQRWLIVSGITLLIALLTVLPQVDELLEARVERADLKVRIENADQAIKVLPQLEGRVAAIKQELHELQKKAVDQEDVASLRRWLVEAARQSGCNLKRVGFDQPIRRRWLRDDSPTTTPTNFAPEEAGPYDLETRSVTLSITGSQYEIQTLLKLLDADQRIKHTRVFELKPIGRTGRTLQLDLTLWYFTLIESKQYV